MVQNIPVLLFDNQLIISFRLSLYTKKNKKQKVVIIIIITRIKNTVPKHTEIYKCSLLNNECEHKILLSLLQIQ